MGILFNHRKLVVNLGRDCIGGDPANSGPERWAAQLRQGNARAVVPYRQPFHGSCTRAVAAYLACIAS